MMTEGATTDKNKALNAALKERLQRPVKKKKKNNSLSDDLLFSSGLHIQFPPPA